MGGGFKALRMTGIVQSVHLLVMIGQVGFQSVVHTVAVWRARTAGASSRTAATGSRLASAGSG